MSWIRVLEADAVQEGTPERVTIDGRDVCVVRADGGVHAFDDFCPHRGTPLSWGTQDGTRLTCAAHTWEWDVTCGALLRLRAPEALVMHEAREADGAIEVRLSSTPPYGGPHGVRMRDAALRVSSARRRPAPAPAGSSPA